MSGFFQNVFQVFFIFGLLLLFVISIIILKPFRIHRKRPVSTIALKVSYLLFLITFLVFTYLLLFGVKQQVNKLEPYDTLFNIHFIIFLSSTIIPTFGVMARRHFKHKRVVFNEVYVVVNIIYFGYMVFAILSGKWALM